MDHSLARPCGSTIKKTIIKNPQMVISKCLAVTADKPIRSTIINFKPIGSVTIKPAPRNEPNIDPRPPIIIINKTGKDIVIMSNDSVTSIAPKKTAKYKAPETPIKKELMAKADNLVFKGGTPIISAAMSISLIAIHDLPILLLIIFLAANPRTTTNTKQNKYVAYGGAVAPVTGTPKKSLSDTVI
jgi:hypothetical protein